MEEEGEFFPPQLLGNLPDLDFFAILQAGRICKGQIPIVTLPKTTPEKEVLKKLIDIYKEKKGIS